MAVNYLSLALRNHKTVVDDMVKAVNRVKNLVKVDAIAWRGTSGAIVTPPVSYLTGVPMIAVRKETNNCHSQNMVEAEMLDEYAPNYIIIDDLVSSGDTIRAIHKEVRKWRSGARLVAVLVYDSSLSNYRKDVDKWEVPILGIQALAELTDAKLEPLLREKLCWSERKVQSLTPEQEAYRTWMEKERLAEVAVSAVPATAVQSPSSLKPGDPVFLKTDMAAVEARLMAEMAVQQVFGTDPIAALSKAYGGTTKTGRWSGKATPWWMGTLGLDVNPPPSPYARTYQTETDLDIPF